MEGITRRGLLRTAAAASIALGLPPASGAGDPPAARLVRDRLWAWAHEAGVYNGAWGLPGPSRITPVEGAHYLGVPNIILIRYEGKPAPPFDRYSVPFASLDRVMWSVTGAGGETSAGERKEVLRLAAMRPNIAGLFLDDFFRFDAAEEPHWLAANDSSFPVILTIRFPRPVAPTRIELVQSCWPSGDYRTAGVAVSISAGGAAPSEAARGEVPDAPRAAAAFRLPGMKVDAIRIEILGTHDRKGARSCGLRELRLLEGETPIDLRGAAIEASSEYPGHPAARLAGAAPEGPPPAALTVEELRSLRPALALPGRSLEIGVTLYRTQLDPRIRHHLECIDVVSLWTWKPAELERLEEGIDRVRELAPGKKVFLGCYMWDFDAGRPIPLELMERQCAIGLRRLEAGEIDGMVFLATNICDLGLEAVEWSRRWIAEVGRRPLG